MGEGSDQQRMTLPTPEREGGKGGLRAVTLLQPFASLVMERVKHHETRSRPFLKGAAGKTVILHSSARFAPVKLISEELHELCLDVFGCAYNYSLPLGAGLGPIKLGYTIPIGEIGPLTDEDRIAGDWRLGRFATDIKDVNPWPVTIPARGMLGLWRWPHALPALSPALSAEERR